jgi:hypothetical protein
MHFMKMHNAKEEEEEEKLEHLHAMSITALRVIVRGMSPQCGVFASDS